MKPFISKTTKKNCMQLTCNILNTNSSLFEIVYIWISTVYKSLSNNKKNI